MNNLNAMDLRSQLRDEHFARLHLVGARNYVRGLELLPLFRSWHPNASLDLRFLRPMTCDVRITRSRQARPSAVAIVTEHGFSGRYFIVNAETGTTYRAPEPPCASHLVFFSSPARQIYMLREPAPEVSELDLVFRSYQRITGDQVSLTRLRVRRFLCSPISLVVVHIRKRSLERNITARITKNFCSWCEIEAVLLTPDQAAARAVT